MTSAMIHPMAVVEPGAQLGNGVRIGPFCHVGADVVLGDGVELVSHVSISGATTIGDGCTIHPHAALGQPPQNKAHKGGRTTLIVGRNCTIRESVTFHLGSDNSRGETRIGDNGNFLAYSHIAHDCIVGNNVTMANNATLGGHCEIGDNVFFGGLSAAHQFTRVGHHAFIGGLTAVVGDVIPYGIVVGSRGSLRGLNIVGMKRSGVARSDIHALRNAFRQIFDPGKLVAENLDEVRAEFAGSPVVEDVIGFLTDRGKRHFTVPSHRNAADADDAAD